VGNYFEWDVTGQSFTKYYFAGATRIAMRDGGGALKWLLGDHLGSTSVAYDGSTPERQGYKAWGETRFGDVPTEYRFTGQKEEPGLGLYFYNSRYYDAYLGRWIQPDNIVPVFTQGEQALDRYAYVNNNSVRYSDPSGHCALDLCIGELIAIALVVGVVALVTSYYVNGGPEAVAEGTTEVLDWATEQIENQVEKLSELQVDVELQGENASFAKGHGGGFESSARHLAMLLGTTVAGFGPHSGSPDPEGRDRKHNAEGLRNDLRNLQKNMKKGESLQQYLERQGLSPTDIKDYITKIKNYMDYDLETDVEYYGVSEELKDELWSLLDEMGVY
jgi:RHS repeat-associated protein